MTQMMKNIIYSKAAIALVVVMALSSCKDMLDQPDIVVNPNAPGDAPIDVLLSGTEVGVAVAHEDTDTRIASYWSGQMAGQSRQQQGYQDYIVSSTTFDNSFFLIYMPAANARLIQQKAAPVNNKRAVGVGQVLEAIQMLKLTTLYGDIAYSQAFDKDKFPKPIYDKQADVYASLIALMNTAYTNLNSPLGNLGDASRDFFYHGDVSKWAKAAKTLQARMYLHTKDYTNAINAATLGITSAGDDMLVPHGGSQQIDLNMNFDMFENSRPGDCGFDAAYLPKFMTSATDPATGDPTAFKRNAKTDDYALWHHYFQVGIYTSGLDPNTVDGAFQGNSNHPILTSMENQLILAEAYARRNTGGDQQLAIDALNSVRGELRKGLNPPPIPVKPKSAELYGNEIALDYILGGMKYDDYVLTDFAALGMANTQAGDVQKNIIYEILAQKYTLTLLQYEAFNDLRRTQVATPIVKLPIPLNTAQATQYPARLIYSQNEINTNGANVPKGAGGGVPDIYQKVTVFAN